MPEVYSSAKQNLSNNFETLHHAKAMKSPTVVIFEDTKHIVVGLFNSCRPIWRHIWTKRFYDMYFSLSQSPCTTLIAGSCLSWGQCKGTATGVWKTVGTPTGQDSAKGLPLRSEKQWELPLVTWAHNAPGNPNLYLDQPITKWWCPPIGSHVSYPTGGHIATRLWLCYSLLNNAGPNCITFCTGMLKNQDIRLQVENKFNQHKMDMVFMSGRQNYSRWHPASEVTTTENIQAAVSSWWVYNARGLHECNSHV